MLLLLVFASPVFAACWGEIFEKQYLDLESIKPNSENNTISFWIKKYNKDIKQLLPMTNQKYLYSISRWNIDCTNQKSRISSMAVYDLKENLIYSDDFVPDWNSIIPGTYADAFYRIFCLVPFDKNPIITGKE